MEEKKEASRGEVIRVQWSVKRVEVGRSPFAVTQEQDGRGGRCVVQSLGSAYPPTQIGFDGGQARESIECRGMSPPKVRPKSITEYIEAAPNPARKELPEMLSCIGRVATDATEGLRWVMPARSYKRILATLAAHKNHIGFYPAPSAPESGRDGAGGIQYGERLHSVFCWRSRCPCHSSARSPNSA